MSEPIQDRRAPEGVLLAIMNHVDQKLDKHTQEEMLKYREIIESIDSLRDTVDHRYDTLMESINSYTDKTEAVHQAFVQAFLTDKRGNPDFTGHHDAHESWVKRAEDDKEIREFVKEQMNGESKRAEDRRFIFRAVIVTVLCAVVMWAGKNLIIDAVQDAVVAGVKK